METCNSCDREVSSDNWGVYTTEGTYYCGYCCNMMVREAEDFYEEKTH